MDAAEASSRISDIRNRAKTLWRLLQQERTDRFVVFDSEGARIALNRKDLVGWHFLWEAAVRINEGHEREPEHHLRVFLSDRRKPLLFEVEDDAAEFGPEENDGQPTQLQNLLHELEIDGDDPELAISFNDVDGERVFFVAAEIAFLEIPLRCVEPSLPNAQDADSSSQPPSTIQ